jgi:hypothetical protein
MGYSSPHLREIIHYNLDQDYNNPFDLILDQTQYFSTDLDPRSVIPQLSPTDIPQSKGLDTLPQSIITNWIEYDPYKDM